MRRIVNIFTRRSALENCITNGHRCIALAVDAAAGARGVAAEGAIGNAHRRLIVFGVDATTVPVRRITAERAIANLQVTGGVVDAPAGVVRGVVAKCAVTYSQRCIAPNEYRIIMDSAGAANLLAGRVTGQCGITHDRRYGSTGGIVDDRATVES